MNNSKKTIITVLAVGLLIVGGGLILTKVVSKNNETSQKAQESGDVLARVNGEDISSSEVVELQELFTQQGQEISEEEALEQVINQKVISQEVGEKGYTVTTEEAQTQIEKELDAQGSSLEEFKQQITEQGSSYEEQLEQIKQNLAIQNYFDEEINQEEIEVNEEESEEFYENYKQEQDSEEIPSYEELKPQIITTLEQQKQQMAINALIQKLKEVAEIEYL